MRTKRALLTLASLALILQAGPSWAVGGTGSFNTIINWELSPDLYYNINGAPANVCGDLYANRNGAGYTVTYGWVCTDGSGNATKGPWTWANQNGDEDAYAYIAWPGGSKIFPGFTYTPITVAGASRHVTIAITFITSFNFIFTLLI